MHAFSSVLFTKEKEFAVVPAVDAVCLSPTSMHDEVPPCRVTMQPADSQALETSPSSIRLRGCLVAPAKI
jgi:hypothetical protein